VAGGAEYLDVGHVVQFYGHEDELADRVAGYLLEALRGEGVAVVIATSTFAFSSDAPAAARHFAADAVRRLGAAELAADAALVVTELAANAVLHAHTGFTVDLAAGAGVLRISVRDASPLPPGAGLPAVPLHGLGAVDALASRWGVEPLGHSGKSVWVELSR